MQTTNNTPTSTDSVHLLQPANTPPPPTPIAEVGGVVGPEPTRFGDWEKNGRCVDF